MTQAPGLSSPWERDIPSLPSNCELDLEMALNPRSILFDSASSSMDSHTSNSLTMQFEDWETHSSKEKSFNSDNSLENSWKPDRKWSMHAPRSTTPSKLRCWPPVPSPLLDKLWTPPPRDSNKQGPITPSIPFYSARVFSMWAMTRQWLTHKTISAANSRQEVDRCHQILQMPPRPTTSTTFWHGSTIAPCATCIPNRSPKMVEMTITTMSEVAVFTP